MHACRAEKQRANNNQSIGVMVAPKMSNVEVSGLRGFSRRSARLLGLCICRKGDIYRFQHVIVLSKSYRETFDVENLALNRNDKFFTFNNQAKYFDRSPRGLIGLIR